MSYDPSRTLNLFLQGNLDKNLVDSKDMDRYGTSEYRLLEPQTYTYKYSFNIDRTAVSRRDVPGENHSIITNINFRKGAFLAVDRQKYINTIAPASTPGYGLISPVYVADPDTGKSYRNTPQAQQVLKDIYGVSDISDITGYDLDAARDRHGLRDVAEERRLDVQRDLVDLPQVADAERSQRGKAREQHGQHLADDFAALI